MKRVHFLSEPEILDLTQGHKTGAHYDYRIRCQIILLSNENLSAKQISLHLKKNIKTAYETIDKYESQGIKGLINQTGQGRVSHLNNLTETQVQQLKKAVDNKPQNLNEVSAELAKKFGFHISKRMLINYLKKNSVTLGAELGNG